MKLSGSSYRRLLSCQREIEWLACTCVLLLVPLMAVLAEPRTYPLQGYFPAKHLLLIAFAAVPLLVLYGSRFSLNWSPPLWMAVSIVLVPFSDNVVGQASLVSFGLASGLSAIDRPPVRKVASGLTLAGICLGTVWIVYLLYGRFGSQLDASPELAWLLHIVSLGQIDSVSSGLMSFNADGRTEFFMMGLDKVGGLFFVAIIAAYVVLASHKPIRRTLVAIDLLICGLYALVRCAIVFTSASGREEWMWWDEQHLLITFAPLSVYLAWRLAQVHQHEASGAPKPATAWLGFAAGCVLAFAFTFPALGTPKQGVVVIDESHSEWEDSRVPIDDVWFGSRTVYNYYNFREELARHFQVEVNENGLKLETLSRASVLILKTPTKPYDEQTVRLVTDFVKGGGGLWLVGDHTNAFGMNTYLNQIAKPLGCQFHSDAYIESPVRRNLWAPNKLTHPVARTLETFLFYTGCSLSIPFSDTATMEARRVVLEPADYSAGSFFGPLRSVPANRQGSAIMASVGERGYGRVALWSDSTLFSNFAIYMPGKLDVGLNTVEWLSRRNVIPNQKLWTFLIGGVLLAAALISRQRQGVLFGAVMGLGLAPIWLSGHESIEPLEKSKRSLQGDLVAFYEPVPTDHLPYLMAIDGEGPNFYVSAFVSAQRVGRRPFIARSLGDATKASTIVLIGPDAQIGSDNIKRLVRWVENGGTLIILDGSKVDPRELSLLAKAGNVRTKGLARPVEEVLKNHKGSSLGKVMYAFHIEGGLPIVNAPSGRTVCASFNRGRGKIILSSTISLFSDSGLGDVLAAPRKEQFAAMQLLFSWLRKEPVAHRKLDRIY